MKIPKTCKLEKAQLYRLKPQRKFIIEEKTTGGKGVLMPCRQY